MGEETERPKDHQQGVLSYSLIPYLPEDLSCNRNRAQASLMNDNSLFHSGKTSAALSTGTETDAKTRHKKCSNASVFLKVSEIFKTILFTT